MCWVSRRLHAHWGGPVSGPSELPPHTFHPYPRARAVQLVMGWNAGRAWGPSVVVIFFFFNKSFFFFSLNFVLGGEGNGTPSSTLAWKIPWTVEPGGLQSMGSLQVGLSNFPFTFHFHALEEEMATHSRILAWRIPGTGEPGGLPSMGLHRVGHD